MKTILAWIVRHPIVSVFLLAIAISLSVIKITTIEIDSSAEGLMVEGDPARDYYEQVKEKFGSDTLTVVVIEAKDGDIFTEKALTLVETLTDEIEGIEGVTNIQSLTTVNKIKGEGDFLNTDKLIDYIPSDPDELSQIKEDTLRNDTFIKNLISEDGKIAGINIFTESPPDDKTFNKRVSEEIDSIIAKHRGDYRVYQIGSPLTKVTFSSYIEKDQKTLIPWSIVLLLVILLISFRSSVAVFLPILTGGLSILTTLGFMTLMGYQINVVTAIVPSLLIAIGCTEDVHMISEYYQALRSGKSKRDAVMHMATHCALPIALTSLTTFLGFATLAVNKITILKQFGIVSAFGLFANFIITIVIMPSALQLFKVPKEFKKNGETKVAKKRYMDSFLNTLVKLNNDHKFKISSITIFIIILAVIGCFKLKVNTDFISYFKEGSFIRERVSSIHNDLSGAINFNIIVETDEEDKIKEPEVLKQIADLQIYMDGLGVFDKSISITNYIEVMNREMNGGRKEMQKIPESKELVAQYLLLLGDDEIKSYVDTDYSTANIAVRHNITSSWELTPLLDKIKNYIDENFSKDLTLRITGEGILINNAADSMVVGQVKSLGLALTAIFIIMTALFLSYKAGLIAIISNTIPIILNFGVMGWLGIPLNTGTCMVAAIALGIAVDDTIHFMVRYQRELTATNDQKLAISNTIRGEGEPILFTSTALALGFGILVMSSFNPTMNFGLLAAFVMIYAFCADLFVTPVLLTTIHLITVWDFISVKLKKDITKESPIFRNFRHSQAKKVILLGNVRSATPGEYVIRQGEKGQEMFMIITGKVKVTIEKDGMSKELGILRAGDILGEMAVVGEGTRSANIIATEDTELLRIDEKSLEKIRRRFPRIAAKLFLNISRILSDRLKAQNIMSVQ